MLTQKSEIPNPQSKIRNLKLLALCFFGAMLFALSFPAQAQQRGISRERSDGLLVLPSGLIIRRRAQIIDFTAKRRLPTMYARSRFVDAGGLMSYGASLPDLWRRAATYVDKILNGVDPVDLPVERATKFELILNLKTAKKLGFTIPPQLLARADRVIK